MREIIKRNEPRKAVWGREGRGIAIATGDAWPVPLQRLADTEIVTTPWKDAMFDEAFCRR